MASVEKYSFTLKEHPIYVYVLECPGLGIDLVSDDIKKLSATIKKNLVKKLFLEGEDRVTVNFETGFIHIYPPIFSEYELL